MDLRVGVQIPHPLDVHHDQLVARPLEGEVAEGLMGAQRWLAPLSRARAGAAAKDATHLRGQADVVVPHKPRVRVVLDVLALDVMFQVEERFTWPACHLHHTHLHDVHLGTGVSKTGLHNDAPQRQQRKIYFFYWLLFTTNASTCLGGRWRLYSSPQSLASICNLTSSK